MHPKEGAGPMALRMVTRNNWAFRSLTFELRRDRRQDARPGLVKMHAYHQTGLGGLPLGLASTEGLGLAGSQSKRNTLCKWGGRVPILAISSLGKKGLQTWRTNNSPETNDMRSLG